MRKYQLLAQLAAVGVVAALTGCAGTDRKVSPPAFRTMDSNDDGKVSAVEFSQAMLQRAFEKLDLNGDQMITFDEWRQFDTSLEAWEHFRAVDENGDEQISLAEFLKLAPKHANLEGLFREMNQNADTYLSADELNRDPGLKIFSIQF